MTITGPFPPRSIVKIRRLWPHARSKGHEIGEVWRIGYYSPQDGLDCIWLVDRLGEYRMTADHEWITKHFDVVTISDEDDFFGVNRSEIEALP
jgi:hypothetical protein